MPVAAPQPLQQRGGTASRMGRPAATATHATTTPAGTTVTATAAASRRRLAAIHIRVGDEAMLNRQGDKVTLDPVWHAAASTLRACARNDSGVGGILVLTDSQALKADVRATIGASAAATGGAAVITTDVAPMHVDFGGMPWRNASSLVSPHTAADAFGEWFLLAAVAGAPHGGVITDGKSGFSRTAAVYSGCPRIIPWSQREPGECAEPAGEADYWGTFGRLGAGVRRRRLRRLASEADWEAEPDWGLASDTAGALEGLPEARPVGGGAQP
jgi:hypothetical protein